MNWNPFKRIADLERRVELMHHEMLVAFADYAMRINMLERTKAKEASAGFVNPAFSSDMLTAEEAQRIADKRVRANAAARKYYAKRKAKEVQP